MSFITQEDYEDRLNESRNLLNIFPQRRESKDTPEVDEKDIEEFVQTGMIVNKKEVEHTGTQGKVKGDNNIPEVIRDVIAIQSNFSPLKDVAAAWGVSAASASNLANGIPDRRFGHEDAARNIRAREVLDVHVKKIRRVVEKKILSALELITQEALENESARSLAYIVNNLSGTMAKLEPRDNPAATVNVQTIFYSPEAGKITDYEIIKG